ncbi:gustatory receptor for sugar taste 64e-like isoform X2 [Venturia canescens]|uniref:gustatory receptor for sugar taste 64e-like isoform X2 n=1 Tax=Venturia canescens TaxID=32260 RepID=UPI001C9C42B7|nr:gustatory receptor for sugar taste 64e-like isoform X2 [Venturia canescens]
MRFQLSQIPLKNGVPGVPKILSNYDEIPSIRKPRSNHVDPLKDITNQFVRPRIFATEEEVDKNITRNWINDTINRPVPPRATVLLRTDEFTDQDLNRESFHCAMGRILRVAQFFGLLPLAGVTSKTPKDLTFNLFHLRTIYAMAISLLLMLMFISAIADTILRQYYSASDKSQEHVGFGVWIIFFYGNAFLCTIFFMRLAPRWVIIQQDWREMERLLDRGTTEPTRLRRKFALITATILSLALLEHVMGLLGGPPMELLLSSPELTFDSVVHSVCQASHPFLLTIVNYNMATGISIIAVNTVAGFGWNFMDLFVILVAAGLVERYKTLNKKVTREVSTCPNNIDWNELRESYATLSKLVKNIDDHISCIILLSFFNNVYFTCLQLLTALSSALAPISRVARGRSTRNGKTQ